MVAGSSVHAVTTYTYNAAGNVVTTTDALGHVTTDTYDAMGRVTSETDAAGNVTEYAYDAEGRQVEEIRPSPDGIAPAAVTRSQYDADGELIATTDAGECDEVRL